MSVFKSYLSYKVDAEANIERRVAQVPFAMSLAPVSASVRPDLSPQEAARLLRRLADAIEEQRT